MQTRIYVVASTKRLSDSGVRLVEASSQSQAVRHVAQDEYDVRVATPKDVGQLMSLGVKIESANPPKADADEAPQQEQAHEEQAAM